MARISPRNPRYRTKEEMAEDVAFILKAPVTYGAKFAVLSDVCWAWTEFHGKYTGCPWWSKEARKRYEADPKVKLKHEHSVPKKVVIQILCNLSEPSPAEIMRILSAFLIGVVITPEEDARLDRDFRSEMPSEFTDSLDPWLRYKQCGIELLLLGQEIDLDSLPKTADCQR